MEEINWQYVGRTEEPNNVFVRPVRSLSVSPFRRSADLEFRRLFSDRPAEEVLIADYFCTLERGFLRQGRLFITSRHLCFHASIFGFLETRVQLPWILVTNLKKRKTAKVIPNAIQIECTEESGVPTLRFSSFLFRRKSFAKLFNTWQRWNDSRSLRQFPVITDDFNSAQLPLLLSAISNNNSSEEALPLLPNDALNNLNPKIMENLKFCDAVIVPCKRRKILLFHKQRIVVEVDESFVERLV